MGLVDRIKRLLGFGAPSETEIEGADVTVHLEHPGIDAADANLEDAELEGVKGIGPTQGDRLRTVGIDDIDDLAAADAGRLAEATDISETRLTTWIERAKVHVEGP